MEGVRERLSESPVLGCIDLLTRRHNGLRNWAGLMASDVDSRFEMY